MVIDSEAPVRTVAVEPRYKYAALLLIFTMEDNESPMTDPTIGASRATEAATRPLWEALFPFGEPYPGQREMIEEIRASVGDGAYHLAEGACGTGKTLAALTALLEIKRESGDHDRLFVSTAVKQQLRAFENDIEAINARIYEHNQRVRCGRNVLRAASTGGTSIAHADRPGYIEQVLSEQHRAAYEYGTIRPVHAVTLTSKADMCCYTQAAASTEHAVEADGVAAGDPLIQPGKIYNRCEDLRDPVRTVANNVSGLQRVESMRSMADGALADIGEPAVTSAHTDAGAPSWTAPYGEEFATTPDGQTDICPFYARYWEQFTELQIDENGRPTDPVLQPKSSSPADPAGGWVMTPTQLMERSAEAGMCPHAVMTDQMIHAEVVIGNYQHVFDPQTRSAMTSEILDAGTLLVCDEAHEVVPRVRDSLSDQFTLQTLEDAIDELDEFVLSDPDAHEHADILWTLQRTIRANEGVSDELIVEYRALLAETADWLKARVAQALKRDQLDDWNDPETGTLPSVGDIGVAEAVTGGEPGELVDALRDPGRAEADEYSEWCHENSLGNPLTAAAVVGEAIASGFDSASEEHEEFEHRNVDSATVGRVLGLWNEVCRKPDRQFEYLPTVMPRRRSVMQSHDDGEPGWRRYFTARMKLHNCIPADAIAARFDQLGGGVIMSATLAPIDAYREETGLNVLEEERDVPVSESVHGTPFPADRRRSITADLPKFNYKNRGPTPGEGYTTSQYHTDTQVQTRRKYASLLADVVEATPEEGNIMVATPSYREAEWVAATLEERGLAAPDGDGPTGRRVFVDESSSEVETERLKAAFFAAGERDGPGAVLTTSVHGTLTTGVDYDGDKLSAVVVLGVPIQSIKGPIPSAIEGAYKDRFGRDGYDYAFIVPAVRKSRQAIGRVIRGVADEGVRVLADERYGQTSGVGVQSFLPPYERTEFDSHPLEPLPSLPELRTVADEIRTFWTDRATAVDDPDAGALDPSAGVRASTDDTQADMVEFMPPSEDEDDAFDAGWF